MRKGRSNYVAMHITLEVYKVEERNERAAIAAALTPGSIFEVKGTPFLGSAANI